MGDAPGLKPFPLGELARWWSLGPALLLLVYLVALDQGAVSQLGQTLHETLHDGRHFLAVPCH